MSSKMHSQFVSGNSELADMAGNTHIHFEGTPMITSCFLYVLHGWYEIWTTKAYHAMTMAVIRNWWQLTCQIKLDFTLFLISLSMFGHHMCKEHNVCKITFNLFISDLDIRVFQVQEEQKTNDDKTEEDW